MAAGLEDVPALLVQEVHNTAADQQLRRLDVRHLLGKRAVRLDVVGKVAEQQLHPGDVPAGQTVAADVAVLVALDGPLVVPGSQRYWDDLAAVVRNTAAVGRPVAVSVEFVAGEAVGWDVRQRQPVQDCNTQGLHRGDSPPVRTRR